MPADITIGFAPWMPHNLDQFEVHHLERRYLIDRISQLFKEIDGLPVERRGKALHAETPPQDRKAPHATRMEYWPPL